MNDYLPEPGFVGFAAAESSREPLDPNGRWITVQGQHIHLNEAGDVEVGGHPGLKKALSSFPKANNKRLARHDQFNSPLPPPTSKEPSHPLLDGVKELVHSGVTSRGLRQGTTAREQANKLATTFTHLSSEGQKKVLDTARKAGWKIFNDGLPYQHQFEGLILDGAAANAAKHKAGGIADPYPNVTPPAGGWPMVVGGGLINRPSNDPESPMKPHGILGKIGSVLKTVGKYMAEPEKILFTGGVPDPNADMAAWWNQRIFLDGQPVSRAAAFSTMTEQSGLDEAAVFTTLASAEVAGGPAGMPPWYWSEEIHCDGKPMSRADAARYWAARGSDVAEIKAALFAAEPVEFGRADQKRDQSGRWVSGGGDGGDAGKASGKEPSTGDTPTQDIPPGYSRGWHLTDNPHFKPDPSHKPTLNSLSGDMISDEQKPAGIFVGDPEYWMHAHGYERPYVAEIEGRITNPPGAVMEKGHEQFMQGDDLKTVRVLPLDEYAREHYGEPGWVETYHGEPWSRKFKDHVGRPTSKMSPQEVKEWERKFKEYAGRKDGPNPAGSEDSDEEANFAASEAGSKGDLDPDGHWVTIEGQHVHLDKEGRIDAGGSPELRESVASKLPTKATSEQQVREHHDKGYRNPDMPSGTIQQHLDTFKKAGSLLMAHRDKDGKPYSSATTTGADAATGEESQAAPAKDLKDAKDAKATKEKEKPKPAKAGILSRAADTFKSLLTSNSGKALKAGQEWAGKLSAERLGVIKDYTDASFLAMNAQLRKQADSSPAGTAEKIAKLQDTLLDAPKADKPVKTYRGVSFASPEAAKAFADSLTTAAGKDHPVRMAGFQSASLSERTATMFTRLRTKDPGKSVLLEIKSRRVPSVASISNNPVEREVIHPHGCSYRVTGVRMKGGRMVATLEEREDMPPPKLKAGDSPTSAAVEFSVQVQSLLSRLATGDNVAFFNEKIYCDGEILSRMEAARKWAEEGLTSDEVGLAMFAADPAGSKGDLDPDGRWITVNGQHIHLTEDGLIDAGGHPKLRAALAKGGLRVKGGDDSENPVPKYKVPTFKSGQVHMPLLFPKHGEPGITHKGENGLKVTTWSGQEGRKYIGVDEPGKPGRQRYVGHPKVNDGAFMPIEWRTPGSAVPAEHEDEFFAPNEKTKLPAEKPAGTPVAAGDGTKPLTAPQQKAMEFLRKNIDTLPKTKSGAVSTGISTRTLARLQELGLIEGKIYLNGKVHGLVVKPDGGDSKAAEAAPAMAKSADANSDDAAKKKEFEINYHSQLAMQASEQATSYGKKANRLKGELDSNQHEGNIGKVMKEYKKLRALEAKYQEHAETNMNKIKELNGELAKPKLSADDNFVRIHRQYHEAHERMTKEYERLLAKHKEGHGEDYFDDDELRNLRKTDPAYAKADDEQERLRLVAEKAAEAWAKKNDGSGSWGHMLVHGTKPDELLGKMASIREDRQRSNRLKAAEPEIAPLREEMRKSPKNTNPPTEVGTHVYSDTYGNEGIFRIEKVTHSGKRVMGRLLTPEGEAAELVQLKPGREAGGLASSSGYRTVTPEWVEKTRAIHLKVDGKKK